MPTGTSLPSVSELTDNIAFCIGIWETNRGGDAPRPRESDLKTVAGIAASMATIEQATMPYAVTAFAAHESLRSQAKPPLSKKEIGFANSCTNAVRELLKKIDAASGKIAPDDFIKANPAEIAASKLADVDVRTMFAAVVLREKTKQLRSAVEAKKMTLDQAVASIKPADSLGLNAGSLKSYIRKATNWGEHRAAWQRKAVLAMSDNIGSRIEAVAVSENGTGIVRVITRQRVEAAVKPGASLEAVVKTVAQQNNPNEVDYAESVWKTYKRVIK